MELALGRLLFLRVRGGIRHRLRQLASPAGLLSFVALVAALWLVLGTEWSFSADHGASQGDTDRLRENIADFMPLGLFAATFFTALVTSGSPLHFSPTEINFLFAGPFTRRDILIYKFCVYLFGAMVNAAIITMLVSTRASSWLAAFSGSALTFLFIQMASATVTLSGHAVSASALGQWRRHALLLALLLAIVGGAALAWYAMAVADESLLETLRQFRHSSFGEVLLAPFVVFARIFLARELFPELAAWASIGVAINAVLLCAIVALDRRVFERSLSQISQANKRWNRIKRSGVLWASQATTGRSLKRAPVFAGIGPIAWRQAINAFRNCGRIVAVFMVLAAIAGPLLAQTISADQVIGCVALIYFVATFVLPKALVLDFRGDFDSIEFYKALPTSASRICAGQAVVAVLVSSAIELVLIAGAWLFLDAGDAWWVAVAALFVLPFNLLLYALENLVFLLFPVKPVPVGRVDFDFIGRTVVEYFSKSAIVMAAVAGAGAIGLKVLAAAGYQWLPALLAAWLTLSALGVIVVFFSGLAFRRFRVSETIA